MLSRKIIAANRAIVMRYWFKLYEQITTMQNVQILSIEKLLPDRESNPGLPRDRRRYSPLYYRGYAQLFTSWPFSFFTSFIAQERKHLIWILREVWLILKISTVWSLKIVQIKYFLHIECVKCLTTFYQPTRTFFCIKTCAKWYVSFRPFAYLSIQWLCKIYVLPTVGLEPTIFCLGGRRLIH